VGALKVADIALPEPSIEEVIRRIYERTGRPESARTDGGALVRGAAR
jgi:hypothetical protein